MRKTPSSARATLLAVLALLAVAPARASIAIYMGPEELAASAPIVIEGTVRASASGVDSVSGTLATYTTIEVEAVHRGPRSLDTIVIRELGGRFGDVTHEVDAVPVYRAGERVLAFLEAAPDGALRTRAMFLGKFSIEDDGRGGRLCTRDLDGHGLLPRLDVPPVERLPRADLLAVVAGVPWRGSREHRAARRAAPPRSTPPELERVLWSPAAGPQDGQSGVTARFTSLSAAHPTRWFQADSGTPVKVDIEPSRNPLGDDARAVEAIVRAMQAWSDAPEGRITVLPGDTAADYTGSHGASPAKFASGRNIILFDDPYEDIPDPTSCSGILALGGYWRTNSVGGTVNGTSFHTALSMYVILNDGFECFLGDADNLAEIATHEIGHGLGFGHSPANDAIMRSSAYANRGPRLGDDDRDAAHCVYPHRLTLESPNGGEAWEAGSVHSIAWSSTAEDGPDTGVVSLEHSTNGGVSWAPVAADIPNDGSYAWRVPDSPGSSHRLRVIRHHRGTSVPATYPPACSVDASAASFTILPHVPQAGGVPDGVSAGSSGLSIDRGFAGALVLNWSPSCSGEATDYVVYEGSLDALRAGTWDHAPVACGTTGDPWLTVLPGGGSRFYLIGATAGGREGLLGRSSDGTPRPASTSACSPRETAPACE